MNVAFYIFSTTNLQDMNPIIYEALSSGYNCWIAFFDITTKKRQLFYYENQELTNYILKNFPNSKDLAKCNLYKQDQKKVYESDYKIFKPDVVIVQEIKPSFTTWYPKVTCKVLHLAWWDESHHLSNNNNIKVDYTSLKRSSDKKYYENYKTVYLGDLREEQVKWVEERKNKQKVCFIPETYIRKVSSNENVNKILISFYEKLLNYLRSQNIKVVWKKREKGYPKEKWASPLDYTKAQPDVIIEKDLNFPTSMIREAYLADFCLVIDDSFAFFDIIKANTNSYILTLNKQRAHKITNHFSEFSKNIIDVNKTGTSELLWNKILDISKQDNNISKKIIKSDNNSSKKIIEFISNM